MKWLQSAPLLMSSWSLSVSVLDLTAIIISKNERHCSLNTFGEVIDEDDKSKGPNTLPCGTP